MKSFSESQMHESHRVPAGLLITEGPGSGLASHAHRYYMNIHYTSTHYIVKDLRLD